MKTTEISGLKQAIKAAYQNKLLFLASMLADAIFFIIYGFATAPIYAKLTAQLFLIGSHAGDAIKTATRESQSMLSVLSSDAIAPYFNNIIWLLLLLAATVYIIYCTFQAFNWKIALQLTGRKTRYLDYLKKFLLINLLWFALFLLYYLLGFFVDIRQILIRTMMQAEPSKALSIILTFYFIALAYFALISYVKPSIKQSWLTGTSKIKQLLPPALLITACILALNIMITLLSKISPILAVITGLAILLPSITIARIYISLLIQKA